MPTQFDPFRWAEAGRTLHGQLPFEGMDRLLAAIVGHGDGVELSLEFGVDAEGIRCIRGHLKATLRLECQRCLEAVTEVLDVPVALALVANETRKRPLPEHYEPLLVGQTPLILRDLVEDELLLALPLVARHSEGECGTGRPAEEEKSGESERRNPFAVLSKLQINH